MRGREADSVDGDVAPNVSLTSRDALPHNDFEAKKRWNAKNLGFRIGADAVSAASAAVLIAPVISIIDRSIMENASGRKSLLNSIKASLRDLVLNPRALVFSRPFALIAILYGGTYLTANTIDTASATIHNRPAAGTTSGTAKFAASSAANVGLCIYKDQAYVRLFGPAGAIPRPVPLASYMLFALRDSMTIFASFNVPPLVAPHINARLGSELQRTVDGLTIAQFAAPVCLQLFSTPLHLLGLDLYNRPSVTTAPVPLPSWRERWVVVRKNWAVSTIARACRIIPAFGVGGVVNTKVRRNLMERLE